VLSLLVGGLLLLSASASALPGHQFTAAFGSAGAGGGQFNSPQGVAINESSGDVYVVDSANNRVQRFDAKGTFLEAWGWGVTDGKKEFERCASSCQAGIAGTGPFQFNHPEAIAVDNSPTSPSFGDVYVGARPAAVKPTVQKFTATGESVGKIPAKEEGTLDGVATDASGNVWIYRSLEGAGEIEGFSNAKGNKSLEATFASEAACAKPGFAVDAKAEAFYVNHERENEEELCPEGAEGPLPINTAKLNNVGEIMFKAADLEETTGVAVDHASGELYVDNVGTIAAFGSTGSFTERFGSGDLTHGTGVAVNSKTRAVYVADGSANKVNIFTQPAGAPAVESVSSQTLTPHSAQLNAQLNPDGADTHYFFQYGTVDCKTEPSSCTSVPAPPGNDIGSGFITQTASVEATGLAPSTIYFYRVLAENAQGKAEGSGSFTTLPTAAGVLADNRAWELVSPPEKFGAGIEAIGAIGGPVGGLIQASQDGTGITYVANSPVVPEPEGNRAPESAQILSTRSSTAWSAQDIVTPHTKAEGIGAGEPGEYKMFSPDLSVAVLEPFGLKDTSHLQEPPLVPGVAEEERGIYRRHNTTCPASCYEPLVTPLNHTTSTKWGGELEFLSASSDMNHVVLESLVSLTTGAPEEQALYEWNASDPSQLPLVNILPDNKTVAPGPMLGTFVGQAPDYRNAVSNDGSRVFWSAGELDHLYMRDTAKGETIQLNAAVEGVKEPNPELPERNQVRFQMASADGSKVFFTDNAPLTPDSTLQPKDAESPADLYQCEIVETAGKPKCKLTDLTPDHNAGEAAAVQGVMLGASEDGARVYFVANGVLAPGASRGNCENVEQERTCNLYTYGPDPANPGQFKTTFIATLSGEDGPVWDAGGQVEANLPNLSSRVSPNGRYLAFMSNRSLTGYNNVDANPEAKGARDEEVFLYDSTANRIVCASCNPEGAQPKGVLDRLESGEGVGLVVDRQQVWVNHWLAGSLPGWTALSQHKAFYQSRYLSDEGRLLFNSSDQLVAPDTNGKMDVYQYEPDGVGSCKGSAACVSLISTGTSEHESAFLDASVSGNDVFFLTAQRVVGADHDTNFDMYDARVCSSESPCLTSEAANPRPCESSEECRPGRPTQPSFGPPASGNPSSPGVAKQETLPSKEKQKPKPLTRKQKLALALKNCQKKYKGKGKAKKRAACERRARKAFGTQHHSQAKKGKK
jgi:hypothetical protein